MKRILASMLVAVTLVANLGFASLASASAVSADQGQAQGRGTLSAAGDGIAVLGGNGAVISLAMACCGSGIWWVVLP